MTAGECLLLRNEMRNLSYLYLMGSDSFLYV